MIPARLPSYCLCDLPFAGKLVVTVFLLSVGLGFCSAMVQLHFKETKLDGAVLPGPANVQEKYCGYREFDGTFPQAKLAAIISGDRNGAFNKSNMTPAFFGKSTGYEKDIKKRGEATVNAERDGERLALLAWMSTDDAARKATFEADAFPRPETLDARPITEEYVEEKNVKVKSIITDRCARCHDGQQQVPALTDWPALEPLLVVPKPELFDFAGKQWVKNDKQTSMDGLAQSTHAHLFGFSVLYAFTGIILAFSRYPGWFKAIVAPAALLFQVIDIGCWWLARTEPPYGPTFALLTLATGGLAAMALAAHIFLSLFDLYGTKGKVMVVVLLLAGLGGGGSIIYNKAIKPGLEAEKQRAEEKQAE